MLLPLLYRATMLTGLPLTHAGAIYAGKVDPSQIEYAALEDASRSKGEALFLLHIFLTDSGELHFPVLDIGIEARPGRAVIWPADKVAVQAEYPCGNPDNYWIARFALYANQAFQPNSVPELIPQNQRGVALDGSEELPAGSWYMGPPKQ